MQDVKKTGKCKVINFSNMKFFKEYLLYKKKNGWHICNESGILITSIIWKHIQIVSDYLLATDFDDKLFLLAIENDSVTVLIESADSIEWIEKDYFIVTSNQKCLLYKYNKVLLEVEKRKEFRVKLIFDIILIWYDGKYGLFNLNGERIVGIVCDEVEFSQNYTERYKMLAFSINGKWGLYRAGIGIIITSCMDSIEIHSKYIECVCDNKIGIYDLLGKEIIPMKYNRIKSYDNKVFMLREKVGKKYLYGVTLFNGRKLLPCEYNMVKIDLEKGEIEGKKIVRHKVKRIPEF